MSGVNKVILIGNLAADPELKTISDSATVANFSIATSENWTDKSGEKQEKTEWHRIVAWNKTAELCSKYLSKGKKVYIEGKLQTRSWEDKDGIKKYTTEIVANSVQFLSGASVGDSGEARDAQSQTSPGGLTNSAPQFATEPTFNASEEIPF